MLRHELKGVIEVSHVMDVNAASGCALARSSHGQDGAYSEVAAARLFRCSVRSRVEKKLAHLARRIA
jgi:hypothetical protein